MKKKKTDTALIVILVMTFFVLGIATGVLIMYLNAPKAEPEPPQIVQETVKNITNVYFPKREIVYGEIPRNSYKAETTSTMITAG